MVLWNVVPRSVAHIWEESIASLFYPENGGTRFLQNMCAYQITWCHILEACNLNTHCCVNLKSVKSFM
jgi:hypothetical protein